MVDLVARHVADVLREAPSVAERIGDLGVALTREPVSRRSRQLGTRRDCPRHKRIDVVRREVEDSRRCARGLRGQRFVLREFVREHDHRLPEAHLEIDQPPVGEGDPVLLLSTQHRGIPVGGSGGVVHDDVNGDHRGRPYGRSLRDGLHVLARADAVMDDIDEVTAWRTPEQHRLIWMEGRTTHYRVDPVGEYVIGVATGPGYRLRRGRSRDLVDPHQLVVLDPSSAHSGTPITTEPWSGRLLVIELPDVTAGNEGVEVTFPEPKVGGLAMAKRFIQLHETVRSVASRLERESGVAAFLHDLAQFSPARNVEPTRQLDLRAVRAAAQHLQDNLAVNVSLDDLARAAGTSKFHLIRQFRAVTGVPPHTFQIAQRVIRARHLLEAGTGVAMVAAMTGFVDESHLHRHFTRRLGITPGRYARAFRRLSPRS
jgi:AraC-like DNA-binding protein